MPPKIIDHRVAHVRTVAGVDVSRCGLRGCRFAQRPSLVTCPTCRASVADPVKRERARLAMKYVNAMGRI